jgi:hypothetical protein
MDTLETLKQDYQNFPNRQTFALYTEDVYFKDPLTEFRGINRYKKMIGFMATWFQDIVLTLHGIEQANRQITTRWTLNWTTPLPWQPRISISGQTLLTLDEQGKINSHIDYWNCSVWEVVRQHFSTTGRS